MFPNDSTLSLLEIWYFIGNGYSEFTGMRFTFMNDFDIMVGKQYPEAQDSFNFGGDVHFLGFQSFTETQFEDIWKVNVIEYH